MTRLPDVVARLLGTSAVELGRPSQALPFLTVDDSGHPHVAMVSGVEVAVGRDGASLHAALASPRTRENLLRSGHAALVVVEGATVHTLKLALRRATEAEGVLGVVLDLTGHESDSVGVELTGITYVPTHELASAERWSRTARVLHMLCSADGEIRERGVP